MPPQPTRRDDNGWAAGRQRDRDTLSQLGYHLADLGAFGEAAAAQRERLAFADHASECASAWRTVAEMERQAGDHRAAWQALRERRRALDDVSDWSAAGLGRMYVEQMFLLAGTANGELADVVFAEADRQAREVPGLPSAVLRAAAQAADNVGDRSRAEHYQKLRDAEQRRVDIETGPDHS